MRKKKEKFAFIFTIFIFLTLISFLFDVEILKAVSLIQNSYLTEFFLGITFASSVIIIFFFLTSLFLWQEHKRKWILPLWVTLFISIISSFLLKISIQRLRPFQQGITSLIPVLESASFEIWNYSFPSFQAMMAFAAIPILNKEFPKFKKFWIIFAGLVGFSRIYFGLHFFSDVLVGGLIGYFIGSFIVELERKNKFGEKFYNKMHNNFLKRNPHYIKKKIQAEIKNKE